MAGINFNLEAEKAPDSNDRTKNYLVNLMPQDAGYDLI